MTNEVHVHIVDKISWLASKPKRIKIAVGGRGSAKSVGFADIMLKYVDDGERICCAREFQNSIDDSVHQTLLDEITRLNVQGFSDTNNNIFSSNGGEVFYKGLARNIGSLKSLGRINRLWIEEGEYVSEKSLKVLTPSVRSGAGDEDLPEIWISMNRGSRQDAIAKRYLARAENDLAATGYYEDDLCMIVEVNWRDNPWFPPELELERLDDKENLSEDEYDHIWNGHYLESVENAIIKKKWFDAALDAHIKLGIEPSGATVATHDPADEGDDAKGYACRTGIHYHDVGEIDQRDGNSACREATDRAIRANADLFVWDGDGMGALLREQIATSLKGIKCEARMFRGSEGVDDPKAPYDGLKSLGNKDKPKSNKDTFKNKRAQFYMRLANRFYKTYLAVEEGKYIDPDELISISSNLPLIDKLRSEVCRIPTVPNGMGKIQLMSKDKMKTLDIPSPNMADCLAMGEEMPEAVEEIEELEFAGWQ